MYNYYIYMNIHVDHTSPRQKDILYIKFCVNKSLIMVGGGHIFQIIWAALTYWQYSPSLTSLMMCPRARASELISPPISVVLPNHVTLAPTNERAGGGVKVFCEVNETLRGTICYLVYSQHTLPDGFHKNNSSNAFDDCNKLTNTQA